MKFAVAALLGLTSAVKIQHVTQSPSALASIIPKVKHTTLAQAKQGGGCPNKEEAQKFIEEMFSHLDTNKDGKIEYEEAMVAIDNFCQKKPQECESEEFNETLGMVMMVAEGSDTMGNNDMAIDRNEVWAFWEHHCGPDSQHDGGHGPNGKPPGCPSKKDAAELIDGIFQHLNTNGDHEITYDEAMNAIEAYCKDHGEECASPEFNQQLDMVFEICSGADEHGNGDMAITRDELWAFWNHHCADQGDEHRDGTEQNLGQIVSRAKLMKLAQMKDGEHCPTRKEFKEMVSIVSAMDADKSGDVSWEEGKAAVEVFCGDPANEELCSSEEFEETVRDVAEVAYWADQAGDQNGAVSAKEAWALFNKHCGGPKGNGKGAKEKGKGKGKK